MPPPDDDFIQLETAKAFNLTPREWRHEKPDDQARMLAHEMMKATREAFISHHLKKRAEAHAKAPGGSEKSPGTTGMNAYEAQKAAMRARARLAKKARELNYD